MTETSATAVEVAATALDVADLELVYRVRGVDRPVLRGVSFSIERGRSYGLVGESGCGKSTAALGIVRYLPRNGRISGGSISVAGQDVLALGARGLRDYHARAVSMVYQNPGSALNPGLRVGAQVAEAFTVLGVPGKEAEERAREALTRVQIADPSSVMSRYPHQLSGGMQQRVVIAMALAKNPALLILDEPTTGLDATVEAEVLDLVANLQAEIETAVLFISHNLGVISKMCDRVGVLYAGRLVEEGPVETVLQDPRHPYTVGLLRCIPRGGVRKDRGRLDTIPGFLPSLGVSIAGCVFADRCALADDRCRTEEPALEAVGANHQARCFHHAQAQGLPREETADLALPAVDRAAAPLLKFDDLGKVFHQHGVDIHALVGVSAAIWPGETLGLVGESGSGKTTLARTLLGIIGPTSGAVELEGRALAPRFQKRTTDDLRSIQIVFQNPDSALNRRHAVRRILTRSMKKLIGVSGAEADARVSGPRRPRPDHGAHPHPEAGAALRRPEAAGRDRPGVRGRPEAGRLRRADERPRRVGAGGDPQPAGRAAGGEGRLVPLHQPRPRRRALHLRPDRRALPRARDGARACRRRVRGASPPLHRGLAVGRADDRRRRPRAHPPRRRHPERGRASERLRLPRPLSPHGWARSATRPSRRSSRSRAVT